MREVLFSIYHHDCAGCKTSEKFPETRIEVSPVVYHDKKKDGSGTFSAIWSFRGRNLSDAEGAFNFAKGLSPTKKASILSRDATGLAAYMTMKAPNTALDRIMDSNCIPLRPVYVEDGLEHWQVITEDTGNISKLLSNLNELGEVRVPAIRNFKSDKKPYQLTRRQMNALLAASDGGYYEWPRNLSLEEVAMKANVPRSTLQTHLRKAESKVVSRFLSDLKQDQSILF